MAHTESDRIAFNEYENQKANIIKINQWLSDNPRVGMLTDRSFYIIENGHPVIIEAFAKVSK